MKLLHLPFTVSYDSDNLELSVTPPDNAHVGAIGVKVDKLAALYDHEATKLTHGTYEAVGKDTISSTDYGVPLGTIANYDGPSLLDGNSEIATRQFRAWPGRLNDSRDILNLLVKQLNKQPLTKRELLRLHMANRYPVREFAMIPLTPNVEFKITANRVYGATAISRASLVCVELDQQDEETLCDGRADFVDRPYWLAHALSLDDASGEVKQNQRRWNGQTLPNYGLRVLQTFGVPYSKNGSTIVYDDTYLADVLVRWLGKDQVQLFPSYADYRRYLNDFVAQCLQEFDVSKDLEIWLPWQSNMYVESETLTSTYDKIIRLTHYGLLRQSDENGLMVNG